MKVESELYYDEVLNFGHVDFIVIYRLMINFKYLHGACTVERAKGDAWLTWNRN